MPGSASLYFCIRNVGDQVDVIACRTFEAVQQLRVSRGSPHEIWGRRRAAAAVFDVEAGYE